MVAFFNHSMQVKPVMPTCHKAAGYRKMYMVQTCVFKLFCGGHRNVRKKFYP